MDNNLPIMAEIPYFIPKLVRKHMINQPWWKMVDERMQKKIEEIIDHVGDVGLQFHNAFIAMFAFFHARRLHIDDVAMPPHFPSSMFGAQMTEETYLSCRTGARVLLGLDEWFDPNEPDVYALIQLFDLVEVLEDIGIFEPEAVEKFSEEDVDKALQSRNQPLPPAIQEFIKRLIASQEEASEGGGDVVEEELSEEDMEAEPELEVYDGEDQG